MESTRARNQIAVYSGGYALVKNSKKDVLTAARERVRMIFDTYPIVRVSFSGGKDSTCVLHLCLQEAKRRRRLPLQVVSFDEEVYDPDTVAYMDRLISREDMFKFFWFCVPVRRHVRGKGENDWITWDPDKTESWVRPMPKGAITVKDFPEYTDKLSLSGVLETYFKNDPRWACVGGIRIEESFNRRRAVAGSGGLVAERKGYDWLKPIYDWSWTDVWHYLQEYKVDHSAYYDKMWMEGVSPKDQRVAPWGNVNSSRFVGYLPIFYPDFWEKATRRIPGLAAQALYGNTKLYRDVMNKPAGLTWQEYTYKILADLDEASKAFWVDQIKHNLQRWRKVCSLPYPDEPMILDGQKIEQSWKRMCYMIGKNDLVLDDSGNLVSRDRL